MERKVEERADDFRARVRVCLESFELRRRRARLRGRYMEVDQRNDL